jgi:hypothetical protein
MADFIQVQNKVIRLGAIAYVDFLESGRAMVLMQGLTQEKQNISLDIEDARRLRALLDADVLKAEVLKGEVPKPAFR